MKYKHLKLSEVHELSNGDTTCRYEVYYQYDADHQILAEIKIFELNKDIFNYVGNVPLPKHEERTGFQAQVGDMRSPTTRVYQAADYCREHYLHNYQ